MSAFRSLWVSVRAQPALVLFGANTVLVMVVGFGFTPSKAVTAVVVTIATLVSSLITAFNVHPPSKAVVAGAFATALTGAAGFGLHLSPENITFYSSVITSGLFAYVWHSVSSNQPSPAQLASGSVIPRVVTAKSVITTGGTSNADLSGRFSAR